MAFLEWLPLIFLFVAVFLGGAILGSFLNVCVARLPQEKACSGRPAPFAAVASSRFIGTTTSHSSATGCCAATAGRAASDFPCRISSSSWAQRRALPGSFTSWVVANVHQLPPAFLGPEAAIPLDRYLQAGTSNTFCIDAPGVLEMAMHDGKQVTAKLTKKGSVFEGSATPQKGKLFVVVRLPEKEGKSRGLLAYDVE